MLEVAIANLIKEAAGIMPQPIYASGEPPFIVYNVTPVIGGTVKQTQVEIKVISPDYQEVLELAQKINNVLDLEDADASLFINNIHFRSALAGGGDLIDEGTNFISRSLIYTLTHHTERK